MTFTKKAANELKERLTAKGAVGVNAMTNHSFCMDVLRRNFREAGFHQMPLIWSSDAELGAVFGEAMRSQPAPPSFPYLET
jgi:superfamily I DNA/RNA helicase